MKCFVLFLLLFLFSNSYSQFPDYYVYLVKGTVSVNNTKGKPDVKQGDFLYKSDALNIAPQSEITLVNTAADYFVLKSGNNLKLSSLDKNKAGSYTGITKKYLHLVWDEVLDPDYDFTKFKNKNLTGVYGGVTRGEACKNLIFPVNGLKTSEDSLNFTWLKTSAGNDYNFLIYDGAGKEVLNKQIKDTQAIINIAQSQLTPGKYYWLIKSNEAACEDEVPLYFELLTKDEENKLVASITPANENNNLTGELEIIDKLERNALIYPAKTRYTTVLKKNPDNEAVRRMYIMFLLNYGFDDEAEKVWSDAKNL